MSQSANKEQVFLSYAHENLKTVRKVYDGLKKRKMNVWIDKENMGSGLWMEQIEDAIVESKYFIVCISEAAIVKLRDKKGVQGKELRLAYNIAMNQAPNAFTIIPIRLEECEHGNHRLSMWHQYDLFKDFDKGLDKIAVQHGGISLSEAITKEEKSDKEKLIEGLFGQTTAAYYAADYPKALVLINAMIKLDEQNAQAWSIKGAVFFALGKHDDAIICYDKALQIEPQSVLAWNNKGIVYSVLRKHEEALIYYDKALQIDPQDAHIWDNKGNTSSFLGKHDDAIICYDKALQIDPQNAYTWNNKGNSLYNLGKHDDAMLCYDKSLQFDPQNASVWHSKGPVLSALGRHDDAIRCYDKALQSDSQNATIWYSKATALYALGKYEEAIVNGGRKVYQ